MIDTVKNLTTRQSMLKLFIISSLVAATITISTVYIYRAIQQAKFNHQQNSTEPITGPENARPAFLD